MNSHACYKTSRFYLYGTIIRNDKRGFIFEQGLGARLGELLSIESFVRILVSLYSSTLKSYVVI